MHEGDRPYLVVDLVDLSDTHHSTGEHGTVATIQDNNSGHPSKSKRATIQDTHQTTIQTTIQDTHQNRNSFCRKR